MGEAEAGLLPLPIEELADGLGYQPAQRVREILANRGLRVKASNKDDLVDAAAEALAEPSSVDAALAAVGEPGRRMLTALYLAGALGTPSETLIQLCLRAIGGEAAAPTLRALEDQALALLAPDTTDYNYTWRTPLAVLLRLKPRLSLKIVSVDSTDQPRSGLDLGEVVLVVLDTILTREIRPRQVEQHSPRPTQGLPPGWQLDRHAGTTADGGRHPLPCRPASRFEEADLALLTSLTGVDAPTIELLVALLERLGVLDFTRSEQLYQQTDALLGLSPTGLLSTLLDAWLDVADPGVLAAVTGGSSPLGLWAVSGSRYAAVPYFRAELRRLQRAILRCLVCLEPGTWYATESLAALLGQLFDDGPTHSLQDDMMDRPTLGAYWLATPEATGDPVLPGRGTEGQWLLVKLVEAMLAGPLTWLGVVDAAASQGSPAFRVRCVPITPDEVSAMPAPPRPEKPLTIADDLTILAAPGTDLVLHRHLLTGAELVEASPRGIRYRLAPRAARLLSSLGSGVPEIEALLAEYSAEPLPTVVRQRLRGWGDGYGAVRLYDDLTLVELGDDFLLPELKAASHLVREAILYEFSPRLAAVWPHHLTELVQELVRLGHSPRQDGLQP